MLGEVLEAKLTSHCEVEWYSMPILSTNEKLVEIQQESTGMPLTGKSCVHIQPTDAIKANPTFC